MIKTVSISNNELFLIEKEQINSWNFLKTIKMLLNINSLDINKYNYLKEAFLNSYYNLEIFKTLSINNNIKDDKAPKNFTEYIIDYNKGEIAYETVDKPAKS